MAAVTYLDPRLRPSVDLPDGFSYPEAFLEYLLFEEAERRSVPHTKTLDWRWPSELHFEEAVSADVRASTNSASGDGPVYLIAFARDAGDGVWFFGPDGIYSVDLGASSWAASKEAHEDFVFFVNYWRQGAGYPEWRPGTRRSAP